MLPDLRFDMGSLTRATVRPRCAHHPGPVTWRPLAIVSRVQPHGLPIGQRTPAFREAPRPTHTSPRASPALGFLPPPACFRHAHTALSFVPSGMQPAERRALLLLLGLAVAGHVVRAVVSAPSQAPGEVELVRTLPAQSPLAHKESTMALARPLRPGERIDIDRAGPAEIARLPRVGPGLAKRIVADRDARGPFGALASLDRVSGVGAGLLAAIADHATFSGANNNQTLAAEPDSVSGRAMAPCPATLAACARPRSAPAAASVEPGQRLSLNQATIFQLDSLPGIGAKRAEAIVRDRERNGPFPSVDALTRVPGIKPALLARVRERLQVP